MAKRKEWKHVIFSDDCCQYDEYEKDYLQNREEWEPEEYSWDRFYEDINLWLDDERMNLDWQIEGTIVAIASLGTWRGSRMGYKIVGHNLKDIFGCNADENEYYCDQEDCHATCTHHDGTNYITYRVIKSYDEDKVEDLLYKMVYDSEDYESDVYKHTHSLMPYIADIFGWKYDRRMKRGDMWNPRTYKSFGKAA